MKNKGHQNAFFFSHGVMSKNTTPPQIVICDPGTVLHLCPRCSFTYFNDHVHWCVPTFECVAQCSTVIKKPETETEEGSEQWWPRPLGWEGGITGIPPVLARAFLFKRKVVKSEKQSEQS